MRNLPQASMFLRNITVVDHAYIDEAGRQVGGSFHASFDVTGKVDPVEQVVVDFSTVKKDIKALVDDRENGFDHKLWWIQGFSAGQVTVSRDNVTITTPALEITAPQNILRHIQDVGSYDHAKLAAVIGRYVENGLRAKYPNCQIDVRCELSVQPFTDNPNPAMFTYSHGLRASTSWGCQNIAHGHLSWLELEYTDDWREDCVDCKASTAAILASLQSKWDGAILVDTQNVIARGSDYISIAYRTDRGHFQAKYRLPFCKVAEFDHETTIEHIVEQFVADNIFHIQRGHVKRIAISEGLAKGAYKEFSDVY